MEGSSLCWFGWCFFNCRWIHWANTLKETLSSGKSVSKSEKKLQLEHWTALKEMKFAHTECRGAQRPAESNHSLRVIALFRCVNRALLCPIWPWLSSLSDFFMLHVNVLTDWWLLHKIGILMQASFHKSSWNFRKYFPCGRAISRGRSVVPGLNLESSPSSWKVNNPSKSSLFLGQFMQCKSTF